MANDPNFPPDPDNPSYYCWGGQNAAETTGGFTITSKVKVKGKIKVYTESSSYADPHSYSELSQLINWMTAAHQKLGLPPYVPPTDDGFGNNPQPLDFCQQLTAIKADKDQLLDNPNIPETWEDPTWPF